MAVKTWTSSDFRDNLVVSYHPDLVIWVWVWNNDNSSMKWVTWITWAWYIWHKIAEKAIELWYIKDKKIQVPDWIIEDYYCLTKNCFQKELIFKRKDTKYNSRIYDKYYSKKDLWEKLNEYEKEKLDAMGFILKINPFFIKKICYFKIFYIISKH
jgi:membrane carboxypeptidase/penicillin-binding protein PbpC